MPLLGPDERPISARDIARVKANAEATDTRGRWIHPNDSASYQGTFLSNWHARIRSADADYLLDRDTTVARTRDLDRNNSVANAGVSRKVNSAVGFGWRLSPRLNARALGITPDAARELRSEIGAKFQPFAYGPSFAADAERCKTFGQQLRMCAAHLCFDGEALGVIEYADAEPTLYKTRLRMVDPDRLSNPAGQPNSVALRGGVERDAHGIPFRYWIREQHPADLIGTVNSMIWQPWDRFSTDLERPQVLHAYDVRRAGQTRGMTRFISALKDFRAFAKFTDATIENATLNALQVGFVSSQSGPSAVSEAFTGEELKEFNVQRNEWHDAHRIDMGDGAGFVVLPPGDELKMATSERQTAGFDAFTRAILRLIAASLGITYEELSMDFSQTNYSSARAALAIAWQEVLAFRGLIKAQIADPFYSAWLEEAIDLGEITLPKGAPDFYAARDVYLECEWIGPPRGYIDPVKEILAAAARIESQTSNLRDECAEQGRDYEENLEQLGYERALNAKFGLEDTDVAEAQAIQDTRNPAKQAPAPADPAGDPTPEPGPEDERPDDTNKTNPKTGRRVLSDRTRRELRANDAVAEDPAPLARVA